MSAVLASVARSRPVGRMSGLHAPGNAAPLAAEWDCCWLDGRPLDRPEDWRRIIDAGRLAEVNGAFALAWSDVSGTLHLARDAIGERTLYWARKGDCVAFASALRPLLEGGLVDRVLHLPSLAAYLSWAYVPGEDTLIEGVNEVLPGEVVSFANGEVMRKRFWELAAEPAAYEADAASLQERLRADLEAAVRRRLPPGETVGATLSGGIDSSLVVALAARLHDAPVCTYSVSFGEGHANELAWSSMVAQHCRTRHRVVEISPQAVLASLDDTVARHADPIGDPLTVPNAILFREAAGDTGVVLNGEGGDPCFGGPKNLPMLLAGIFDGMLDGGPATGYEREAAYLRAHMKCYDDLPEMLRPEVFAQLREHALERYVARDFGDPRWRAMVTRLQWMNLVHKGAHHILHKVDEVSAAAGMLSRAPLFDRDVVECAFAIPPQMKLRGTVEKYLLKRAVADLLPRAILERPKSGMLVPVEGWFRGPLKAAARERILDGLGAWNLFERSWLERLVAGKLGGLRPRHGVKTWLLLTLEAWLRRVLR